MYPSSIHKRSRCCEVVRGGRLKRGQAVARQLPGRRLKKAAHGAATAADASDTRRQADIQRQLKSYRDELGGAQTDDLKSRLCARTAFGRQCGDLFPCRVDADKAVIQVENFMTATRLAQTTLRSVLGKHELDEMVAERDKLNSDIQEILDSRADAWGIKVANVEIKHVDLNEKHDSGYCAAGGSGAKPAGEDHQCGRGAAGSRETSRSRFNSGDETRGDAASIPEYGPRYCRRAKLDDRLPVPIDLLPVY